MYKIQTSRQFEKDFSLCARRNYNLDFLEAVIQLLEEKGFLPLKYKPHPLLGKHKDYWECHIKSDWLLIWKKDSKNNSIELVRTGTHSDLF
ncbi:MAG: type II toxin-antitoxin system YafQ family toxin [Prolixibacteraceae bacterium]|nr:type II toxin-antitoxin system YafQ family toxin [Prolixibacteraceae bacterium]